MHSHCVLVALLHNFWHPHIAPGPPASVTDVAGADEHFLLRSWQISSEECEGPRLWGLSCHRACAVAVDQVWRLKFLVQSSARSWNCWFWDTMSGYWLFMANGRKIIV